MMKHKILTILIGASLAASAQTQGNVLSLTTPAVADTIIYPESFDTDIKNLYDNWYLQRYAVLDSMTHRTVDAPVSDAVYIERLQRLPNVIEMPYNSIVRKYIEMYAERKPQLVEKMLGMSLYYMPIFEDALERQGLPLELKYLPVIESALDPNAKSKAGAVGLWQFMPSTATGEGLEVNSLVDERRDPLASSDAAASYLKKLYDIYGDWSLAVAAYNCGPGNVNKALKRAGGENKDFWAIYPYLPEETRGYIPAFIAANYIMNYYGAHGISPALARRPLVTDTVHVTDRVHFNQISDVLGISIDALRTLNPQYREDVIPGHIKPYTLVLPSVQAYCYVANVDSILRHDAQAYAQRTIVLPADASVVEGVDDTGAYVDEVTYTNHTVKRGETLKSIATKYSVTTQEIQDANGMTTTKVRRGQRLRIPRVQRIYTNADTTAVAVATTPEVPTDTVTAAPQTTPPPPPVAENKTADKPASTGAKKTQNKTSATKTHTVKSGESLFRIASRYGITVAQLKKANNMTGDTIHPGQKLKIPAK